MSTEDPDPRPPGDPDFTELTQRHRREIHVHCYRMLGSFDEAEDVTQDVFLRAWKSRASITDADASGVRAWLYRIATNACLDVRKSARQRVVSIGSFAEVPWLQPYPDRLLDELTEGAPSPDEVAVARETIELAYVALAQTLPPKQRAVVLLRDVLEWSAADTAAALDLSVAAANSALQRGRETLAKQRPSREATRARVDVDLERELVERFIDAHERQDVAASIASMHEDIRVTMPPHPMLIDGRDVMEQMLSWTFGEGSDGDWRLVPTAANRMPAAASYLRAKGDTEFRLFKIDVIRVEDGLVREVTTFGPHPAFGLPEVLGIPPGA